MTAQARPHLPRARKLRHSVALSVGGATLLLLLIVAVVLYAFVYFSEKRTWQSRQSEATHRVADHVGGFLDATFDSLSTVGSIDPEVFANRPTLANELLAAMPALSEVVALTDDGTVYAAASQDEPLLANLFTIPMSSWFRGARAGSSYLSEPQLSFDDTYYVVASTPAGNNRVVAARLGIDVLVGACIGGPVHCSGRCQIFIPPSAMKTLPVEKLLRSEARNSTI